MKTENKPIPLTGTSLEKGRNKAFTLVELIIVITILAILATIGFMSFQGYMGDARDASRTTSLDEIRKGLEIYKIKNSKLPMPTNSVSITASGINIGYQGIFGKTEADLIKMTSLPIDPLDNTGYIYSINSDKNKFQLLTFLENQTAYNKPINDVYAIDYSNRKIKTIGDKLGIFLDSLNNPILTGSIETITGTTNYNIVFSNENIYSLSGNLLTSIQSFRGDKNLANIDNSLAGYWDMETLTNDGKLKDLSKNGNNGVCYDGMISGVCGIIGPKIINLNGIIGKSMHFDGIDDNIVYEKGYNFITQTGTYTFFSSINILNIQLGNRYTIFQNSFGTYGNRNGANISSTASGTFLNFGYYNGTEWLYKSSPISTNLKYNIVGVLSSGNIKLFVNGQEYLGKEGSLYVHVGTNFILGKQTYGGYGDILNGLIDEVRIYNRALSDSEIKALYDSTK